MNPLSPGGNTSEMRTAWGTIFTQLAAFAFTAFLMTPYIGFSSEDKLKILGAFAAYVTGSATISLKAIHSRQKLKEKAIESACPPRPD